MNDINKGLKDENIVKINTSGKSSATDPQAIFRIILALNSLKMNIGMYPDGHASVDKSVDRAYLLLRDYFRGKPEINIGVTGKTLLVNETILDKNNKNFQEYAHILNVFHIILLKIKHSVTKQELFQFSKILASKPSEIRCLDRLENLLPQFSIKGIEVKSIDTGYFQLSNEKKSPHKSGEKDFWQEFILRMSSASDEVKTGLIHLNAKLPANASLLELIQKLNDNSQFWQKAVAGYEKMVEDYLHEHQTSRQANPENYEMLGAIASLINNFHPALKEQLLSAAQRQITLQPETALTLENMNHLPDELLPMIVHLANERHRQLPPALLMLLQRFSATGKNTGAFTGESRQKMTPFEMEKILKKEKYEEYIPEKYDKLLRKLSAPSAADNAAIDVFPLSLYLKTLDAGHIDLSISKLVFALLEEETQDENYLAYSKRLAQFIPDLLRSGQFSLLVSIMETFRHHGHQGASESIRRQAMSVLSILADPDILAQNATGVILRGSDTAEASKFLIMSGVQNIPWLFDLYLDPSTPASNTLISLLKGFGGKAVEEAARRIKNQSQLKILRIVAFLRETGDESTIPLLKDLYEYDDYVVKKDIIEILLSFRYSGAIELLRKSLRSTNHREIHQGVSLTVFYEVSSLMGELMSLLKTFHIRESDTILNELIVRQLGGSGNSWAVPYLEMITAVQFSLSPRRLTHLKEILYESLGNFPRQEIQLLLERGVKSWNRKIRENCLKIMEHKEA